MGRTSIGTIVTVKWSATMMTGRKYIGESPKHGEPRRDQATAYLKVFPDRGQRRYAPFLVKTQQCYSSIQYGVVLLLCEAAGREEYCAHGRRVAGIARAL